MVLELLKELGLSEGEIKVYSAILEIGITTINKIHEKTGIERRNIYDIINKLIEKGFISYTVERGKRTYQSAHPSRLSEKVENRKRALNKVAKQIPQLIKAYSASKPEINAEIYRGIEGTKTVWGDTLNYKSVYWVGAGRYIPKRFPLFFANFNKRRIKSKTRWINLLRAELKKEVKKPMPYEHIKFLPKEFSGNPTVICIYGNKVVNFLLGETLFAFVIESKELAENYKRYHKYLWQKVAISV